MRNNEKNSIELHAFCTQFYPPTLSNFTCMHEYPPLPKKKKKKFPPIDPSFDSHPLPYKIHQKEISIIVYYLLNNSIFNLSPLPPSNPFYALHLSAIFIHPSNERRCTHSFKHPVPGSRLIEGIDYPSQTTTSIQHFPPSIFPIEIEREK